jgi:hypothetical protein
MNKVARVPQSQIGVTPTQSQKLSYISTKLGIPGIKSMQGSSVNLYDTIALATNSAGRTTLSFFKSATGKSRTFSNFQGGTLKAGESMVIEELAFYLVTLSAADLNSDATYITAAYPLSQVPAASVQRNENLKFPLINVKIANSNVVKDFLGFECNPVFNNNTSGIALGQYYNGTAVAYPSEVIGHSKIKLEAPPVLPPNQTLQIDVEFPLIGTITGNVAVMCVAGRFGSIFAAKTTL